MALVEWAEDFGQYKKGDQFELSGPSLDEYLATGKVKPVKTISKDSTLEKSETATLPKQATIGITATAENATEVEPKPSTTAKKK